MEVFLSLVIPQFVMYCVNGRPRSSLFIESTDSMIGILHKNALVVIITSSHGQELSSRCVSTLKVQKLRVHICNINMHMYIKVHNSYVHMHIYMVDMCIKVVGEYTVTS